jgi:hypothetical protein
MSRTYTTFLARALDAERAQVLYTFLETNVDWQASIPSRRNKSLGGFTRYGKSICKDEYPYVYEILEQIIKQFACFQGKRIRVWGLYLNYYVNGQMFTPSHSHTGTKQIVLSLGATRTLVVGKKSYAMENGDAILFGGSIHSVPQEPQVETGRISIACFAEELGASGNGQTEVVHQAERRLVNGPSIALDPRDGDLQQQITLIGEGLDALSPEEKDMIVAALSGQLNRMALTRPAPAPVAAISPALPVAHQQLLIVPTPAYQAPIQPVRSIQEQIQSTGFRPLPPPKHN